MRSAAASPTRAARVSSSTRRWPPRGSTPSRRRRTSSTRTCPAATPPGLADRLLRAGFIVRELTGFGAPGAIRVTAGTDEENALFAEALPGVVAG